MLAHGDEIGRTQGGNNNAYCQDNELSWVDWDLTSTQRLLAFTGRSSRCAASTRCSAAAASSRPAPTTAAQRAGRHRLVPAHRRADGRATTGTARPGPIDGVPQRRRHPQPDSRGRRVVDDDFLVLFNADHEEDEFIPPRRRSGATLRSPRSTPAPTSIDTGWPRRGQQGQRARPARWSSCAPARGPDPAVRSRQPPRAGAVPRGQADPVAASVRPARPPYRLQVHGGFGFDAAAEQTAYLASLGVSHLYLSPVLQPAPGSMHGYDVVDHTPSRRGRRARGVRAARRDGLPRGRARHRRRRRAEPHDGARAGRTSTRRSGRCCARALAPRTRAGSTSTGSPRTSGCSCRCSAAASSRRSSGGELTRSPTTVGPDGTEPVLRYYDHEFPVAPGTEELPLAELVDGPGVPAVELARGRRRAQLPAVLRRHLARRRCGSRTRSCSRATHALLLALHGHGEVDGFRIDHPDGLADPGGYLERLADATGRRLGRRREDPRGRGAAARRVALRGDHGLRRAAAGPAGPDPARDDRHPGPALGGGRSRTGSPCTRSSPRRSGSSSTTSRPPRSTA